MRKYIRFNYFEPILVPAREALQSGKDADDVDFGNTSSWDMGRMLEYIVKENISSWNCEVNGELAEIEPGSVIEKNVSIKGFQLTKLRVTNIPSKKKLGKIKEDIMLQDDEYIGEFVTCFYDTQLGVLGVQSNKYGLNTHQIEEVFTNLRLLHCNAIGSEQEAEDLLIVKLRPILSPDGVEAALNATYIRKIKMRVADFMHDSQLDGEPLLSSARRLLGEFSGGNIEITINVGRSTKETLDKEMIGKSLKLFSEYRNNPINKNSLGCEITKKDYDDTPVDIINLIEPRFTDVVSAEIEPRTTIAHEYLFDLAVEKYSSRRAVMRNILVPIEE